MDTFDSPIEVTLTDDGEPAAFVLERFEYDIIGQPQAHYTRSVWWDGTSSPNCIDTEFWLVDAARDNDELTRYDLRRDADGTWYLTAAWR
ncbi:hypothetical protein [Rathayibacter iranicus]|uniref:hypothetical protein n=1 Tax=Rathayibacter iranicus TaxID=59737 RepID=UPI001327EDE1|nr:hypothetical protein [Rathayibacter iranicus]MWV32473.1 hypothetical protein [Rathayibacter iranicus NCPPB 2253 = VKM Ac-1602]